MQRDPLHYAEFRASQSNLCQVHTCPLHCISLPFHGCPIKSRWYVENWKVVSRSSNVNMRPVKSIYCANTFPSTFLNDMVYCSMLLCLSKRRFQHSTFSRWAVNTNAFLAQDRDKIYLRLDYSTQWEGISETQTQQMRWNLQRITFHHFHNMIWVLRKNSGIKFSFCRFYRVHHRYFSKNRNIVLHEYFQIKQFKMYPTDFLVTINKFGKYSRFLYF